MNLFILSQILVSFAFVSDFVSFQIKRREYTLLFFAISALLISSHYFLLGAITGGFAVLVSAIRFCSGIFTTKKSLMYVFILLTLCLGFYSFKMLADILPIIAGTFGTVATFQASGKSLRQIMMFTTSLYIIYNIIIFSPMAIALESFMLISNLISYFRFFRNTPIKL